MKMFIPEIGTEFSLLEDWTFKLYAEYRNFDLLKVNKIVKTESRTFWQDDDRHDIYSPTIWPHSATPEVLREARKKWELETVMDGEKLKGYDRFVTTVLPKNTALKVDRIYVRKGMSGFSSVSFFAYDKAEKKPKRCRFWAKLADVNNINFEVTK